MGDFTSSLYSTPGRLDARKTVFMLLLAACVGSAAGLGAVGFRWLVRAIQEVFFVHGAVALGFMQQYYVIVLPAVGGLAVGLITYFGAREAAGQDVPEIVDTVARREGRFRPRASIGSGLGQWSKRSPK